MWRRKSRCAPLIHPGCVWCHCRSLYLHTAAAFRYSRCARAHCRSPLRLNEHRGHVSETAAAGTVAPQWIHGQLCSCAPLQSEIREKPSETEKCDRRWRVSSNASARCPSALTLMRSIFALWNIRLTPCVLGRHREAPRLGCVGVAMADRDSLPLPLEVRARFAELELELSEGE